jgi:hypothetical protein
MNCANASTRAGELHSRRNGTVNGSLCAAGLQDHDAENRNCETPGRFASHWSKAPLFSSLCLSTKCHGYFPEVTKISCSQLDRYITHLICQQHPASRGLKARISGYVIVASFEDEYRCRSRLSSTNRTRAGRLSFQPAFLFAVLSRFCSIEACNTTRSSVRQFFSFATNRFLARRRDIFSTCSLEKSLCSG